MSKTVGYARVSTSEQNLDRQLQALEQYVEPDMIVTDKASGKSLNRPGYQSLKIGIGKLVEGDILYITSLDRQQGGLKAGTAILQRKGCAGQNIGYANDLDRLSDRTGMDWRHDNEHHDRGAVEHRPE